MPKPKLTSAQKDAVELLYQNGSFYTQEDLGEIFNCHARTIRRALRELGVPAKWKVSKKTVTLPKTKPVVEKRSLKLVSKVSDHKVPTVPTSNPVQLELDI